MQVTFDIPEDIGPLASAAVPLDRAALEGLAAQSYQSGVLSQSASAGHIRYRYTEQDLAADLAALTELGLR
jgi:hypothetical protein